MVNIIGNIKYRSTIKEKKMLRVSNIKISIDEDKSKILKLVLNKLKIKEMIK